MQPKAEIPFVSLRRSQNFFQEDLNGVIRLVIESGHYSLGPETLAFESSFASFLGVEQSILVSCGYEAIRLAILSLPLNVNASIWVPAYGCPATALAVANTPFKLKFLEIDLKDGLLDLSSIPWEKVSEGDVIIPVHLFGKIIDMPLLMEKATEKKVWVIEDFAQAQGAKITSLGFAGSFGHANATSFYPTKNLAAIGEAGAVSTNVEAINLKVQALRQYGELQQQRFVSSYKGGNYRADEVQAAVLNHRLKNLQAANEERRRLAKIYLRHIKNPFLLLPVVNPALGENSHVWHAFVVNTSVGLREKLLQYLNSLKIGNRAYYSLALHLQPALQEFGFQKGDFPMAELFASTNLALPLFCGLKDEEVLQICEHLNAWEG